MKYAIFVLSLLMPFATSADPQIGDNGVHWPLSNEFPAKEFECQNCAGQFHRDNDAGIVGGFYSEIRRVPINLASPREFSSQEANFGCNLVNGDNATNVQFWKATYTILDGDGTQASCPDDWCTMERLINCSEVESRVFP